MCRNVNVFLSPVTLESLLFSANGHDAYVANTPQAIQAYLHARTDYSSRIAEDCTKKSTKAGYDAGGIAVGVIPLTDIFARFYQTVQPGQAVPRREAEALLAHLQEEVFTSVKYAKDGGDILKTWPALAQRLQLDDTEFVTNWATHVRQASQGDMYSESNAHPHFDVLARPTLRLYALDADGRLVSSEEPISWGESLFYDTHNGDINDAAHYKAFLTEAGFVFTSNSDSCVEPALKRFLYEHLRRGQVRGALHKLALEEGFFPTDAYGSAETKAAELLILAETLQAHGARKVTIAAALAARTFEYSHDKNKFTFQSFTPIGETRPGVLGGGTYTMTRGGAGRGGEEGGELIFYLPKAHDKRNYGRVAFLSASEENALKQQVALLDAAALAQGRFELARPQEEPITYLPDVRATAWITEGVAPIYDVFAGEIVEVSADGSVRLFDLYSGMPIPLIALEETDPSAVGRRERLAPLKVFDIQYRDDQGQIVACPYNKYGEEIMVIQPLAIQKNSDKLFRRDAQGRVRLNAGPDGLGLTLGATTPAGLRRRARQLTHVITGAAGTSFLINTIAANMARKLSLHTLPIVCLDGFTGSDTVPPYVGRSTLFIANSNSGGTSDTIKLAHELASIHAVINRLRHEVARRPAGQPEVQSLQAHLAVIEALERDGVAFADWPAEQQAFLKGRTPWVYVVTNIEASPLGSMGRGLDPLILSAAGAGVTNLPEEECVGSTFAAIASTQWQMALYTYLGELRGDISSDYASTIYAELARLPEVVRQLVSDAALAGQIATMSQDLVGGNFDFVYTGYVDGVPEEQAHKAAEMIQEMFAGWNFFQFQHGKYAHMKRRTRHTVGSILVHNAPPPSWPFFNARAMKAPKEIGPRVANCIVIAHASDRPNLESIVDYAPDYIFTYPADSVVLYPFQALIIGHLISYYWGLQKKEIGRTVETWNQPFVDLLLQTDPRCDALPAAWRPQVARHARQVLAQFLTLCQTRHYFDRLEGQRKTALVHALAILADLDPAWRQVDLFSAGGLLPAGVATIPMHTHYAPAAPVDDQTYLQVLKELAFELSNTEQSKRLADHFLIDEAGRTIPQQITLQYSQKQARRTFLYDYLIEYEGLSTFYDVEPVHPPKIAKAKKGWL